MMGIAYCVHFSMESTEKTRSLFMIVLEVLERFLWNRTSVLGQTPAAVYGNPQLIG
jgi:hypothetical protein